MDEMGATSSMVFAPVTSATNRSILLPHVAPVPQLDTGLRFAAARGVAVLTLATPSAVVAVAESLPVLLSSLRRATGLAVLVASKIPPLLVVSAAAAGPLSTGPTARRARAIIAAGAAVVGQNGLAQAVVGQATRGVLEHLERLLVVEGLGFISSPLCVAPHHAVEKRSDQLDSLAHVLDFAAPVVFYQDPRDDKVCWVPRPKLHHDDPVVENRFLHLSH